MIKKLALLNQLTPAEAETQLLLCCGSHAWAKQMAEARPFQDEASLFSAADRIWRECSSNDYLEAFTHHPRIGEKQLRERFSPTADWASQEQKGDRKSVV